MKNSDFLQLDSLTTRQMLAIDKACIEFEHGLSEGNSTSLERMLDQNESSIRKDLFVELLHLEISHLRLNSIRIGIETYLKRFPADKQLTKDVWAENASTSSFHSDLESDPLDPAFPKIRGYNIQKRLARGGMGVVYLAEDVALNRQVAIKMLATNAMSMDQIGRFKHEARAISSLSHPNINQLYSVGDHLGQPYLVLEYAGGGTLMDKLDSGPMDLDEALSLMITLAGTIKFMHQHGILHQDLKPSNVFFNEEGSIKIGDFGLSKILTEDLEQTFVELGTPAFMAPEQVNADTGEVSELTDIYSLGAIMHCLLTGVVPYKDMTARQILEELSNDSSPPDEHLTESQVPEAFVTLCLRCLEKNPTCRYQSADALLHDLMQLKHDLGVSRLPLHKKHTKKITAVVTTMVLIFIITLQYLSHTATESDLIEYGLFNSPVIGYLPDELVAELQLPYSGNEQYKVLTLLRNPELPLNAPQGLALYRDQYLAIADTLNHRILLLDIVSGQLSHLAGNGQSAYSGDGGLATMASLNQPMGLDFDDDGNFYFADRGNHSIRMVDSNGIISTLSGNIQCKPTRSPSSISSLCYPSDISVVSMEEYYIADTYGQRIRYKQKKSSFTTPYQHQAHGQVNDFNPSPRAMALYQDDLYFIEGVGGRLLKLKNNGSAITLKEGFHDPVDIDIDFEGNIYISDLGGYSVTRLDKITGGISALNISNSSNMPVSVTAIAIGAGEKMFFSDVANNSISVVLRNANEDIMPTSPGNEAGTPAVQRRYDMERLEQDMQFSYIDTGSEEFFSDIAYKLGLTPYIHQSISGQGAVSISNFDLNGREMIILSCLIYSAHCGVENNTLYVASPESYPLLTSSPRLKIDNPLAMITNGNEMPEALKNELNKEVQINHGHKRFADEFFYMLEDLSIFEYQVGSSMAGFNDSSIDLQGRFNLGDLHAALVLWKKISLTYDHETGTLIVNRWQPAD